MSLGSIAGSADDRFCEANLRSLMTGMGTLLPIRD